MSIPITGHKKLIVGLVVAIAVIGGYIAYDRFNGQHAATDEIILYGNIDIREADLAFNIGGRIDRMLVQEGDKVERGQKLATLEAATYDAQAKSARAVLDAQKAALDRLLAGSRPEEIKEARANVQAIIADLEDARSNLQRAEKLVTNDFVARQTVDNYRARTMVLESQLNAAEQRLSLAVQGPRNEDIAEARAQFVAAKSELELAQQRLDYTQLYAKGGGVITTRIVEPGAVILAQSPVYTVALSDSVWVRTYVSEPDLGRIHQGMTAAVSTDSAPEKIYEGSIGFISPVAEFTPKSVETTEVRTSLVYRLRVYIKQPDDGLRQGMPVTVRIKTTSGADEAEKAASK